MLTAYVAIHTKRQSLHKFYQPSKQRIHLCVTLGPMDQNAVLSVGPNEGALLVRHTALQSAGIQVTSVMSLAAARFEIEMGRCGHLLMCHRFSTRQAEDIARLFRRYCPQGRIVFVTDGPNLDGVPQNADTYVPESSGPRQIVQVLRAG